jgi:HlyD family secretion protein
MSAARQIKSWHVAGIVLVLAVGGLLLYGFWPVLTGSAKQTQAGEDVEVPSPRAEIDAVVAQRTSFPLRTQASGHLVPWHRAALSPESEGRVVERPVEEGDAVREGDLLLRLDDREEQIALQEARAQLLKAQAEFAVKSDLPEATSPADTSQLAAARQAYSRAQKQFAKGEVTREAVQDARRRYQSARVSAGLERRNVMAAQTGLMAAEQAVARARLNVERTRIEAPFDGRVADLNVQVGQRVSRGEVVATLLQDRRLKVEVDVLESDVVDVRENATVQVHVPSIGPADDPDALFDGRVWSVNPQVDPESGTARVTVAIPNPNRRLVAGLYANVRLETDRLADRLVVPDDAVLVRQGRDLVFVVDGGRAKWTYVDVGARSGNFVSLESGVSPGDTVAVDGHFALAHDAPVTVAEVDSVRVP